ncbi:hypothetical protein [Pseudoclavibacter soli]|nr:hypothetical protein [Pseudoclavibacter soli]
MQHRLKHADPVRLAAVCEKGGVWGRLNASGMSQVLVDNQMRVPESTRA